MEQSGTFTGVSHAVVGDGGARPASPDLGWGQFEKLYSGSLIRTQEISNDTGEDLSIFLDTQYGRLDRNSLDLIGRMGGIQYTRTTERFEMVRPKVE